MNQDNLNYDRVATAIDYLTTHFKDQPDLAAVASQVHLSPEHFQRIFTEWAGVSPKKFTQYLTVDFLKSRIREFSNLQDAADAAGLSTQSRVYDLFVNIEGVTPDVYRRGGEGLDIRYGWHDTPFGECFIAVTDRGICGLMFVDESTRDAEMEEFRHKWNFARFTEDEGATRPYVDQIFRSSGLRPEKITLQVQGTNFQIKVWEALLRIPSGALTTYAQIAKAIDKPHAFRAVGTAIGSNPVAFLIPCHRVIRQEGTLGGYHWGMTRKNAIIGWEMAQTGAGR
jgi:AraC family transcriptional regulator of adaptative response/methylated-DNA-[protein]-cysteine methyltransferase